MLTLAMIQFRLMPLPQALAEQEWVKRLHQLDGGVPYGIALAAAALLIYPDTPWMQPRLLPASAGTAAPRSSVEAPRMHSAQSRFFHQRIFNRIWIRPINHELTFG